MKDARKLARQLGIVQANAEARKSAGPLWAEREPLLLRALEPRILLDAAGAVEAIDFANGTIHGELADAFFQPSQTDSSDQNALWSQTVEALETVPPYLPAEQLSQQRSGGEIAFIASDVEDVQALISSLSPDVEVVLLSDDGSGVAQIAEALRHHSDVDAVHIFSHGTGGSLSLGGVELTLDTMSSIYAADLASIGSALSDDGDILIYGCDFASSEAGELAAKTLAEITGADVAASTDLTGHESLGGDWELEARVGTVEARTLTIGTNWIGSLAAGASMVLVENDPGIGSVDNDAGVSAIDSEAQTFTYDSGSPTYEVDQIDMVLKRDGGAGGSTLTFSIRATETGANIVSGNIRFNELGTSYAWHSIMLDSAAVLNSGQEYFIFVTSDSLTKIAQIGVDEDNSYADGTFIDGGNNDDALFRVVGRDGNSAPEFTGLPNDPIIELDVDENESFAIALTATDADNDTLTYSIVDGASQNSFQIDANTGVLSFAPPPDFENPTDASGMDNLYGVTVAVSDGQGGSDERHFVFTVLNVDEAPEITVPGGGAPSILIDENQTAVTTVSAADPEGGALTYSIKQEETPGTFAVDPNTGTLTFINPPDFENPTDGIGQDNVHSVTVEVSDAQGNSSTQLYVVTVRDVNEAPVAQDDTFSVLANGTVTIDVLNNDQDEDDDALTITQINGAAIVDGGAAITVGNGTVRLVSGELVFAPNANYAGPASFSYVISDGNGLTSTALVSGTVTLGNTAPDARDDTITVLEDGTVTIDVLDNDTDANGDTLTIVRVNGQTLTATAGAINVEKGTVRLVGGELVFEPNSNENGAASFSYTINDGTGLTDTATVNLNILSVNDAPNGPDVTLTMPEDAVAVFNPIRFPFFDFDDPNNDLSAIIIDTLPAFGLLEVDGVPVLAGQRIEVGDIGLVTFTPDANTNSTTTPGTDYTSFTFRVVDDGGTANGGLDTDQTPNTFTVRVTSQNDAPNAVDNDYNATEDIVLTGNAITDVSAAGQDFDTEGDALTLDASSIGTFITVEGGTITLTAGGAFTYLAPLNFSGTDSFDYTITDGSFSDTATLTFDVAPINDAPVARDNIYNSNEDEAVNGNAISDSTGSGVDSDADSFLLTLDPVSVGTFATVEGGSITLAADGSFTYTPPTNFVGSDIFSYTVTDGNLSDNAKLTFVIGGVNDAPVARDDVFTVDEDSAVSIDVLGNDSDPEGGALVITHVNNQPIFDGGAPVSIAHGSVRLASDRLLFTPNENYNGPVGFTYSVADADGEISVGNVTGNVLPVADAPTAYDNNYETPEDTPYSGNALTDDTGNGVDEDVDGDALIINTNSIGTFATDLGGTITVSENGDFTYTPPTNVFGADSFDYSITDGTGSDTATLRWDVTPVNDAPIASDVTYSATGTGSDPISGNLMNDPSGTANATDPDGDALFVGPGSVGTFVTVKGGTILVAANGSFTYTPPAGFTGNDEFVATVTDGTATVPMTVRFSDIDTPPVVVDPGPVDPGLVDNGPIVVTVTPGEEEEVEEETEEEAEEETEEKLGPTPTGPLTNQSDSPSPPAAADPVVPNPVTPVLAAPAPALQQVASTPDLIRLLDPISTSEREPVAERELPTIAPRINYEFKPIDRENFTSELERTGNEIREHDKVLGSTAAKVTFGFGAVLGVGSVTWILQSGILAATLLSALPAWKRFDPIGVVSGQREGDAEDEDDRSDLHVLMESIRDAGARVRN
ncbi:Ig-like domain-containing protein [Ahrensia sp. R2A130]|uniref:Ig-like domain-containing protein n=1 Tax=Ahrensia sp. R2A130 TaxID=744979 RepID=UPI0001E0ACE2|nr:Ig-like domain-containing protein [Ahrensia sp. R2A130]EFL88467.1 putative RTX toxin [Ahrensia sp. R2A130]